jgi:hypothetical protein
LQDRIPIKIQIKKTTRIPGNNGCVTETMVFTVGENSLVIEIPPVSMGKSKCRYGPI